MMLDSPFDFFAPSTMSTLTGIYRARSFMCLGLVLVAIGWLYQRILFRRQPPPVPAAQPGA
jgi:uncharacterized membrane protein